MVQAADVRPALRKLRAALLKLKPTGADGFEGLLATVLGRIAGQDFRLAKSGLQNGKDGATTPSTGRHIAFEAKRYDGKIDGKEVLAKITQLIGTISPPDMWVLGATVEVSTQLVEPVQTAAFKNGIGILILDWPSTSPIPPLAVACALAPDETCAFLQEHVSDAACVQEAEAALAKIRQSEALRARADAFVRAIQEPSLALANAKTANAKWLEAVLADRVRAKANFGQVLAPKAEGLLPLQPRPNLVQQTHQHLMVVPSRKIVALVGAEGCGKSWLLANSWLELEDRPLLVIVPAADLKPTDAYADFKPLLIKKLIQQMGESDSEIASRRWERRLKQWKELENDATPRFILCVDGLNQQPRFDWPRWLDGAAAEVEQLGGALIVTARQSYFNERIATALHTTNLRVHVPEWTEAEIGEILRPKGINPEVLDPSVLAGLRNPRILGIAFELHGTSEIQNFNELSAERLLFEHIRIGAREGTAAESPEQFAKRLAQHAQEIMSRMKQQARDDVYVFDRAHSEDGYALNADLLAVTAEHFFQPLPNDPTLYTVGDAGLSLALGISIIRALMQAERNQRDVDDALDQLIEPITALDRTADAIFAGVMVASIDDNCSLAIRRALIGGFLRLQNIDTKSYPAFVAVARRATEAAVLALFDLAVTKERYSGNKGWLSDALRECRDRPECWAVISGYVSDWLRSYSLDPSIGLMSVPGQDPAESIDAEKEHNTHKFNKKIADLSAREREFLKKHMIERSGSDPALLWEDAFEMLAGMSLADFTKELVACSFSRALNSGFHAPYDEYRALIRFNCRDWQETRQRLLEATDFLSEKETSSTGKWALVEILRSTGASEDADREERLVEELTKDREKFEGWRRVAEYCATDPCDPASLRPDNIDPTSERYAQVNVDEVSRHRWVGEADHFVRDARPGLARFSPDMAVETQRRIARSIVSRDVSDLARGIPSLEAHGSALDLELVSKLVEIANTLSSPRALSSGKADDAWVASQYALQISFPHLEGDEQLDVLIRLPPHGPPLLKLGEVLKPAMPEKLEQALDMAAQSADPNRALVALVFARHSGTELTPRSWTIVGSFARNGHTNVRAQAKAVIAHLRYRDLIEETVCKGWSAAVLDPQKNYSEIWYGSHIVLRAAEYGMLSADEALDRITPRLYGWAAKLLGVSSYQSIGARLKAAVATALEIDLPFSPPAVEQEVEAAAPTSPPLLSLAEPNEVLGPEAFLKQLTEAPQDFEASQRRSWASFQRFERALTKEKARLIVEDVGYDAIDAYVSSEPAHGADLARELLRLDERRFPHIQNIGLMLARAISRFDAGLARTLFDRLSGKQAIVNLVFGHSSLSLEAVFVWESAEGDALDELRVQRLDRSPNDHQLAQEVLAALRAGKSGLLEQYVRANLERSEPTSKARALMVIGFGAQSPHSDATLKRYASAKGFLGKAATAARFAYDRDAWSRHWFEKMCVTESAQEFWTFSALFLKVVDARIDVWGRDVRYRGSAISSFGSGISDKIKDRAKSWKSKREKTLCGEKAPGEVYIVVN